MEKVGWLLVGVGGALNWSWTFWPAVRFQCPSGMAGLRASALSQLVVAVWWEEELVSAVCGAGSWQWSVLTLFSPAPPLEEWNGPLLLFAFPSLESKAVVLKCGFYIVDQKMRPERLQKFGFSFICSYAPSGFLPPSGQAALVPRRPKHAEHRRASQIPGGIQCLSYSVSWFWGPLGEHCP